MPYTLEQMASIWKAKTDAELSAYFERKNKEGGESEEEISLRADGVSYLRHVFEDNKDKQT